jgi:hypothetical protein
VKTKNNNSRQASPVGNLKEKRGYENEKNSNRRQLEDEYDSLGDKEVYHRACSYGCGT